MQSTLGEAVQGFAGGVMIGIGIWIFIIMSKRWLVLNERLRNERTRLRRNAMYYYSDFKYIDLMREDCNEDQIKAIKTDESE